MSRLASGLPETTTGPESPPSARSSAVCRRSPPLLASAPWHRQQREASSGRTFFSNRSTADGDGGSPPLKLVAIARIPARQTSALGHISFRPSLNPPAQRRSTTVASYPARIGGSMTAGDRDFAALCKLTCGKGL